MITLYMDESGFTGENLLSADQPIFVHVSISNDDKNCNKIRTEHFLGVQGQELKHKNLGKHRDGQRRIASMIGALSKDEKCTSWIIHKEFLLLTYIVDIIIEPAMHSSGIDLYKDGANLSLCNMLYYCLDAYQGPAFLRGHLKRFQKMMIQRTSEARADFVDMLYKDYRRVDHKTQQLLTFIIGGTFSFDMSHLMQIPKRALDPAITTLCETCNHWRKRYNEPISIIHDRSSNLAKDKWLWDLISSPDIENKTIGSGDRVSIFPLDVVETRFKDSKDHVQLQVCDLVAGATAAWHCQFVGCSYDQNYIDQLGASGIEQFRIGAI